MDGFTAQASGKQRATESQRGVWGHVIACQPRDTDNSAQPPHSSVRGFAGAFPKVAFSARCREVYSHPAGAPGPPVPGQSLEWHD